jgi:hypothetical protein
VKKLLALSILLVVVLLGASTASAQVVTPVSLTASSTFSTYDDVDLINDSGLVGGLHDEDFNNMWMADSGDLSPTVTFDLGSSYSITAAQIWQYNATTIDLSRGVNGFNILVSPDDITYTPITSANLAVSTGGAIPAQIVPFSATARYVRFVVTSNHGGGYTGLSEVKFETGAAAASGAIPTLSGWAMSLFCVILATSALSLIRSKS